MTAQPTVSFLDGSTTSLYIGQNAELTLRFDNTAAGSDVGYAPYVNIELPTNGADGAGVGNSPVNDGVRFISATYLGMELESWVIEFDAAGHAVHPFVEDSSANPIIVNGTPGNQLLVLRLPFGSFTPDQTPVDISLKLALSNLADLNTPLNLTATGGFAYGADPFNNPCCDPPVAGPAATLEMTPTVATLSKLYSGPEQETATGPSYVREWTVQADFAPGQHFTNVKLTDVMPDGTVVTGAHLEINGVPVPGTPSITLNADGTTTVVGNFAGTITGGTQVPTLVIDFWVKEFLHDGTPVLNPDNGSFRRLDDNARLDADWQPIDGRDPVTHMVIDPVGPENSITAKSIAVQKDVALVNGDADGNGVPDWQPHGILEYGLHGQISNYFEMDHLTMQDTLGDGQTFGAGFTPHIVIRQGGVTILDADLTAAEYSVAPKNAAGQTLMVFDISKVLADHGLSTALDGNGGGLGGTGTYNQATVDITYRTSIDTNWTGPVPGDTLVDQGDPIINRVDFAGNVYSTQLLADDAVNSVLNAGLDSLGSSSEVRLPVSEVGKSIYAINGDTSKGSSSFSSPSHVQSGDLITYKLTLDMPLTSAHAVKLSDFLPLPVLRATDANADGTADMPVWDGLTGVIPTAGHIAFAADDTFHVNVPGVTPTLSVNAAANSLTLNFGDVINAAYPATHLSLLYTTTVNDQPFGDGLYLTNMVTSYETNSFNEVSQDNAIIRFVLGEPRLKITKGVIGTDNPTSSFTAPVGPVSFTAPGTGGNRFSGTLNSNALDGTAVNANLNGADAGDTISFAIILENKGQGWKGAFDTLVNDVLPAGYSIPPGGLNIHVSYGDGSSVPYHLVGGGLFDAAGGLMLDDASLVSGCIGSFDPTSGKNVVVITYDLKLEDNLAAPNAALTNTATIVSYAAEEGGTNRAPYDNLPDSDSAYVSVLPGIDKSVLSTSLVQTTAAEGNASNPDLAIGERVTYSIVIKVPEGIMHAVQLDDLLPTINGQIKALSATVTSIGANVSGTTLAVGQSGTLTDSNGDGVADKIHFDFGTVTNLADNATNDGKDGITVQVVGVLTNAAGNTAGDVLTNTATLSATDAANPANRISISDTADIDVVEPHLTLDKSADRTVVDAGDTVTYTIKLTNTQPGYNAPAFDVSIQDLLGQLPPNMHFVQGSVVITHGPAGTSIVTGNGLGDTSLKVTAPELDPGDNITITFQATVDAHAVVGTGVTNTATSDASSLPGADANERGYQNTDTQLVTIAAPTVTKAITATSYTDTGSSQFNAGNPDLKPGEVATYTITITLPEGDSPNLKVTDLLADVLATGTGSGFLQYVPGSASVVSMGANLSAAGAPVITVGDGNGNGTADRIVIEFGTVHNAFDNVADAKDQIVITLQAKAADVAANQDGDVLTNSVTVTTDNTSASASASADVVLPKLGIAKVASIASGDAGDLVTYTVTIAHVAGSHANAYDVNIQDLLAPGEVLVLGSASTSAGAVSTAGGRLFLHVDQLNLGSGPITLTYQARLADDVVNLQAITNTATLEYHSSSPAQDITEGRLFTGSASATVNVALADSIVKTLTGSNNPYTTGGNVAVGEQVTYTLTATLGEGGQHVVVTDTLPNGLSYVSSQVLSIGSSISGTTLLVGDAGSWDASTGKLTFDFGQVINAGDNVANVGDKLVVQVVAQVVAGTAAGTVLLNTATVAGTDGSNPYGVNPGTVVPGGSDGKSVTVVSATVGDRAWVDVNGNGVQDGGEAGLAGVVVQLLDGGNNVVATATTAADGSYVFTNVVPGSYHEHFIAPAGWAITKPGQGNAATDSDANPANGDGPTFTLTNGQVDYSHDIGLYQPITLGDRAWVDENGNGLQELGEGGLPGTVVRLLDASNTVLATTTTDAAGNYSFAGLAPGQYHVQFVAPAGYATTPADQGGDGVDSDANTGTGITPLKGYVSGDVDNSIDGGFYIPASLGDRAWVDANGDGIQNLGEAGLAGVTVKLYDAANALVGTTTTLADGSYAFTGLRPGTYHEVFIAPAGSSYVLTRSGAGTAATDSDATGFGTASGSGPSITLVSGQNDITHDAGFYQPVTIGDRVWTDANGNGRQDAGETGLAGVTVKLVDAFGSVVATTSTDVNGSYLFLDVVPGQYQVQFVAPAGYGITQPDATADGQDSDADQTTGLTPLKAYVSGDYDISIDAGMWQPVRIGDYAFEDFNGNGIQDAGDAPLAGVVVTLHDSVTNAVVATATTAADGSYSFVVPPGSYYEQFTAPLGYVLTRSGQGTPSTDSDASGFGAPTGTGPTFTLVTGQTDNTHDAGFYRPITIGDRVFEDQNGNGRQDAGDTNLAGVTVKLLDGSNTVLATTTTDANGLYSFGNLPPGQYHVQVVAPAGYNFTTPDAAADNIDSDANPATGITPTRTYPSGANDSTIDAGLWRPVTIGDRAWVDTNGNGQQDSGETGLAGVTVTLVNEGTGATYTTTTDASGNYLFTGLPPGTYHEVFSKPAGYQHTLQNQGAPATDSDANQTTGIGPSFAITSGVTDLTHDAGYYIPGHFKGTVFLDTVIGLCGDKLPAAVFKDVTVNLLDKNGTVVATSTTDNAGNYSLDGIPPGTGYQVQVVLPNGLTFIAQHSGRLHDGSDVNPATGLTDGLTLLSGQTISEVDAGLHHVTGTTADALTTLAGGSYTFSTAVGVQFQGGANVNLNAPGSYIVGGNGGLVANANAGGSILIGGTGFASLNGGPTGGSVMMGGQGGANIEGTSGNDIIIGGCGAISAQGLGSAAQGLGSGGGFLANLGGDLMIGGKQGDVLEFNHSSGTVYGGGGDDYIHASADNVLLAGGTNDGTISYDGVSFSNLHIGDTVNGTGSNITWIYQAGDGVQWIENFNPNNGDRIEVWGYGAPTAVGSINGYGVLYFGTNQALVFNSWQPGSGVLNGIVYHPESSAAPGAIDHINPQVPVVLSAGVNAFYGTQGDDIVVGSDVGTTFIGKGGSDYMVGGAGNDTFYGNGGYNNLRGGAGDDLFYMGTGSDSVNGGSGTDTVLYGFDHVSASWSLNSNGALEIFKPVGIDLLRGVEKVQFTDGVLNTVTGVFTATAGLPPMPALAGDPDFNGDGHGDILFRHTDGTAYIWELNGTGIIAQGSPGKLDVSWQMAATADFNGDGKADILWQQPGSGALKLWTMNGLDIASEASFLAPSTDAAVKAVADFNGDGKADIMWQTPAGYTFSWLMDGSKVIGGGNYGGLAAGWEIRGNGDFDGDSRADLLWHNTITGDVYLWEMSGSVIKAQASIGHAVGVWQIVGTGDFGGDGKTDVLWQNQSNGDLYVWQMNGFTIASQGTVATPGTGWHVSLVEDMNHDHKADIVLSNDAGEVVALMMNGLSVSSTAHFGSVGSAWQIQ